MAMKVEDIILQSLGARCAPDCEVSGNRLNGYLVVELQSARVASLVHGVDQLVS